MYAGARKSFIALTSSVIVLFICTLLLAFGFSHFLARQASHASQAKAIYQLITIVKQDKQVNAKQLIALNRAWLPTYLVRHQPVQAKPLSMASTQAMLLKELSSGNSLKRFSLQLDKHVWLVIEVPLGPSKAVVISVYSIATLLLLALLLLLCYWTVHRLSRPLKALAILSASAKEEKGVVSSEPELQAIIGVINQLQQRVRLLSMAKTQMLAAISHDLRTPITRLKLRSESFKHAEQYPKIQADLDEMEQMIDSILCFIQAETEESSVKFDLHALLETVVNEQQDAGHDVCFVAEDQAVPFTGQLLALKRVFNNLIDNAIKYGHRAELTLKLGKQDIVVMIDDEGEGLPESELKKVFQPFYRSANTSHIVGSGLGLVFVQNVIAEHQGHVSLSNRASGGLRVTVRFKL